MNQPAWVWLCQTPRAVLLTLHEWPYPKELVYMGNIRSKTPLEQWVLKRWRGKSPAWRRCVSLRQYSSSEVMPFHQYTNDTAGHFVYEYIFCSQGNGRANFGNKEAKETELSPGGQRICRIMLRMLITRGTWKNNHRLPCLDILKMRFRWSPGNNKYWDGDSIYFYSVRSQSVSWHHL